MSYRIIRPPLHENFHLPTREELFAVRPFDLVKVMFQLQDEDPERMWVIVTAQGDDEWTAVVDNDPIGSKTAEEIPAGTIVKFHPYDIIQTNSEYADRVRNQKYLQQKYGL